MRSSRWFRLQGSGGVGSARSEPGRYCAPPDPLQAYGHRFEVRTDVDRDGVPEDVVTGVFEADDGSAGAFLAVLGDQDPPRVLFLEFEVRERNFGVLLPSGDGIRWQPCMVCGDFRTLRGENGEFWLE